MDPLIIYIALGVLLFILGLVLGYFTRQLLANQQLRGAQSEAKRLLNEAIEKHEKMLMEAREEAVRVRSAAEADSRQRRGELLRLERRFAQKEEKLERKLEFVDRREKDLTNKEKNY
jgi:ribonuclease Y